MTPILQRMVRTVSCQALHELPDSSKTSGMPATSQGESSQGSESQETSIQVEEQIEALEGIDDVLESSDESDADDVADLEDKDDLLKLHANKILLLDSWRHEGRRFRESQEDIYKPLSRGSLLVHFI